MKNICSLSLKGSREKKRKNMAEKDVNGSRQRLSIQTHLGVWFLYISYQKDATTANGKVQSPLFVETTALHISTSFGAQVAPTHFPTSSRAPQGGLTPSGLVPALCCSDQQLGEKWPLQPHPRPLLSDTWSVSCVQTVSELHSTQNLAQNTLSKYQLPSPFLILASRDRLSGDFGLGQLSHRRWGLCSLEFPSSGSRC